MIKTPWFPVTIKPARKGVYEATSVIGRPVFSYWNGKHWLTYQYTPRRARQSKFVSGLMYQDGVQWRGLTQEQK